MFDVKRTQPDAPLYRPEFEHDNCGIGACVNIKGKKSRATVENALKIVENLEHRAGKDAEGKTGDGVGILTQIPHNFFKKVCQPLGIDLKGERDYGVGMFFLPQDELKRNQAKKIMEVKLKKEGLENPALEVRHICSLLQMIAGITVNNGHQFTPGQFLAMGQQRGLDAASKSAITGFITKEDDIGTVESPFGKVQLVQLIGVKAEEIEQMKNKTMTPAQLAEILKDGLTDYKR